MRALLVLLAATGIARGGLAAEKIAREELGRRVKLAILVDKVMQAQAHRVTEEWMVRAAAEAGFNVLSPRSGHARLDEVRRVAQWCKQYGIYYMPWMRGSLAAPDGPAADGRRLVWANGGEKPLWSPNSDEFWQWTTRYVVEYARLSAANEHLMGVFLDFENYVPGGPGDLYDLSYDDAILGRFAAAEKIDLPRLAFNQRKPWLDERGLGERFRRFQVEHWRERCRALRQAVDRLDPRFQFCIYPAPGTPFVVEAIYPEWSTSRAPLILADASTYGRQGRFVGQNEALERNRQTLAERRRVAQAAGIPLLYAGGIDPAVRGADAEFSGKNAVMISALADGYWIFYEGPSYSRPDHAEYWKWFTWANRAIAAGRYRAWREPRATPEGWGLGATTGILRRLVAPAHDGQEVECPAVKFRGANLMVAGCRAGRETQIAIASFAVGKSAGDLTWRAHGLATGEIASGTIARGRPGVIRFTAPADGLFLIEMAARGCAWTITRSNVPVGLYAGDGLRVIGPAQRLYFAVPAGCRQLAIEARGSGRETVRVDVRDPDGKPVATGQTSLRTSTVRIKVPVPAHSDRPWSLEIARADEGLLEDSSLTLDRALVPLLSLRPEHVFRLRAESGPK